MDEWNVKRTEVGILLKISIAPNSKKTCLKLDENDRITLKVKAPPVKGKANKEIERYFKKIFAAPVKIIKGHTSREKILEIQSSLNIEACLKKLKENVE